MNNDQKQVYLIPELKNRSANPIAAILKTLVWVVWIGGAILGVGLGAAAGKVSNMLSYYGGRSGSDFSFSTMLITWALSFAIGLFPYAFAEIISLLHQANNIVYRVESKDSNSKISVVDGSKEDSEETNTEIWEYKVEQNDDSLPFNIEKLIVKSNGMYEGCLALSLIPTVSLVQVEAVLVDINVENRLGEPYTMDNVVFTGMSRNSKNTGYTSADVDYRITRNMCANIKSVTVVVKEYSVSGKTYVVGKDGFDNSANATFEMVLQAAYGMTSSYEIWNYVEELAQKGEPIATDELRKILKDDAEIERMYGNHYNSCIKKLEEYFSRIANENNRAQDDEQSTMQPTTANQKIQQPEADDSGTYTGQEPKQEAHSDSEPADYTTQLTDEAVFCMKCGTKVDLPDSVFCPSCGAKLVR